LRPTHHLLVHPKYKNQNPWTLRLMKTPITLQLEVHNEALNPG
jgi:hypothetical protein